ncbi:Outer membrane protein P5 [Bibersteinia trehalosi USDA-ARS-USMARC-189]|uniref:Outer membrane protein A n=1 Tax=Bibersteinia trehalosi USDA-ARS-USMARC-189 TaxID=1263831 RepID=A0ABM7D504_BIBTR|nr:porin OmpA [Bibersteinia trehalosi]AGH37508.1 Outer membrane protein P5 [Bibersteinia trehalosi USDA-ARS-USMARC-192]AHG85019.1 Outer membrane protein P5 [Bibersteinia trehalosi USDA-ARS-USMARC-189]
MKKSLVALAVAGFAVASANAAPEANSVYVGAKAGWASFHDGISQIDHKNGGKYGINKNSVTYGAFVGYQIIDNLAAEVGYEYFGRVRGLEQTKAGGSKKTFRHSAHGTTIALKGNYEVISGLDTYAKAGIALVNNSYKTVNVDTKVPTKTSRFQSSLILGAGVEYAITPSLGARIEYQWLNNAGKASYATLRRMGVEGSDYRPDISSVSAGLTYRFGQGAAPVAEPEIVTKNFAFSSDVLFDFGKANLKSAAKQSLDAVHAEIQNLGLATPAIQVNGYTDRIGKDAPNLALSQRRAESVANYMVSKGVAPESITAVGYGKANPVTGNTCDAVKGRKALIACLAPDRRVELQVQGSKEVSM